MKIARFLQESKVFIKKHLTFFFCLIICFVFLLFLVGCDSTVESIVYPKKQITRNLLDIEVENFLAIAENRYVKLDRQDALRRIVLDSAILYTKTGNINPLGLLSALFGLLGVGVVTDSARKKIKAYKNNGTT